MEQYKVRNVHELAFLKYYFDSSDNCVRWLFKIREIYIKNESTTSRFSYKETW